MAASILLYDGQAIKMLEYNADIANGFTRSLSVAQWHWIEQVENIANQWSVQQHSWKVDWALETALST